MTLANSHPIARHSFPKMATKEDASRMKLSTILSENGHEKLFKSLKQYLTTPVMFLPYGLILAGKALRLQQSFHFKNYDALEEGLSSLKPF